MFVNWILSIIKPDLVVGKKPNFGGWLMNGVLSLIDNNAEELSLKE
jgi:hypothetical protein